MGKVKNKKNLSEAVINNKLKNSIKKQLNPFEVHVNKEKMNVLGRKLKNDRGLPGVSRAKALKKRKATLLQEYQVLGKTNKFTDRRIGEQNRLMNEEEKSVARFTAERVKKHSKKSIFNLADDEILTHKGQTLNEIEKFDDPRSDDDDDDNHNDGRLESNFVEDAHFGGGLFKNTGTEGAKSHKDLIDQLIAESKKRKAEKQKIKEQTLDLTEKLDTEWKDLLPLVTNSKKINDVSQTVDDYDKVMRELKFEARGIPSDRLKSEDELAKEEKEKLEHLEQDRLKRMKGIIEEECATIKHKSADDLDDNFEYDEIDPDIMLSYDNEGVANVDVKAELNGQEITANNTNSVDDEDGESNEDSESEAGNEEGTEEEEEEDINDNFSDLKSDKGSESEDEASATASSKTIDNHVEEKIKIDLLLRKNVMEKAREELPYTFALPNSYEELYSTLQQYDRNSQCVALERMIKCNHPSLNEKNKEHLGLLFAYLLQYISDISTEIRNIRDCFNIFNHLVPLMFDLGQLNQESVQNNMKDLIIEKHAEFRKNQTKYPDLDLILYFKLISCLFPTSDFRHPVVTPSFIYMEQILNKCKVKTKRDICYGLFIVNLIIEYTRLSKRFLPAAVNYLAGILHMAIPKRSIHLIKVLPPFKLNSNQLVIYKKNKSLLEDLKLNIEDMMDEEIDDSFKIRAIYACLKMLNEIHDQLENVPSICEIFAPIYRYLCMIPFRYYPDIVREESEKLNKRIEDKELNRKLVYLVMPKSRPKALRLYEPQIEKVFDTKRYKVQSREKAERDKLLHKLKREKKGALREIRRDQAFLGRLKINERIKSDTERKEKVKKIYAEASVQQSELNAMSRKNKRLKR